MIKAIKWGIKLIHGLFLNILTLIKNIKKIDTILFIPKYNTGGGEKVHLQIVKSLDIHKCMVFFTYSSKDKTFYQDFKNHSFINEVPEGIYKIKILKKIYISILLFFFKRYGNIKNIFGCNNPLFYEIIAKLPHNSKIKKIDLLHAFAYPDRGIENFSIKYVDKLDKRIVINSKTKDDYIQQYTENNIPLKYIERIEIIQNAIEIPPVYEKINNNKLNVLYAGRTTHEKRPHLYTQVANILKERCNFYLAGDSVDKIDVSNIHYFGNLKEKELQKVYKNTDVLVLTSYREGFPMVIMEAMANGVVCIATDVGSISEHIKDDFNGFVIKEKEEDHIVKKIVEKIIYLDENIQILGSISKNSYNYAKENFSLEVFNKKYKELFYSTENKKI